MSNIVCYVRPWNEEQFKAICDEAFPSDNVIYISDFEKSTYSELQKIFHRFIRSYTSELSYSSVGLMGNDAHDVILRCRLLRNIAESEAKKLVICMWQAIDVIYNKFKPELGIGLTIDSYVIDLLKLRLEYAEKPYLGIIVSFVNGYFRLTARGEYKKQYSASVVEVDKTYESLLVNEDVPHFLQPVKSISKQNKRIVVNNIKAKLRYYFFSLKLLFSSDKFNYHYLVNKVGGMQSKDMNLNLLTPVWQTLYKDNNKKEIKLFLPLQYFPEATVDYWVPEVKYIDYEATLNDFLSECSKLNVTVYVKEHPAILGLRPKGFYKQVLACDCVKLVPSFVDSKDIIKNTDATVVWTGSAGFEAALRGKPVIHLGKPYYVSGEWFHYLSSIDKLNNAISWVKSKLDTPITKKEQKEMIAFILSCCLPGKFKQPKRSKQGWVFEKTDMVSVGRSIKKFMNSDFVASE